MFRRALLVVGLVVGFLVVVQAPAAGHAGLQSSDPMAGATLGASPTAVRLTFTEAPAPSLSTVRVLNDRDVAFDTGAVERAADDSQALIVRVRALPRGIYTVHWRIFSGVDGHATAGAYAFGVRVPPTTAVTAAAAETDTPRSSLFEVLGRWLLLLGLAVMLGSAAAAIGGFGNPTGGALALGGWIAAALGLLVLADAQRRTASASVADLLDTSVGRALTWRAVCLGAAGAALLLARLGPSRVRRPAMFVTALAAMGAMAVHVAAGHAAGGESRTWASVATQWAHFAAMGVWLGGLAALVLAIRGQPSETKSVAVRRFSLFALIGFVAVLVTGLVRSYDELDSWSELGSTGYGRAIVAKAVLIGGIALFAAYNRWRNVPARETSLRPLRRASGGELLLAGTALVVAAVLGTLTPPADAPAAANPGIQAEGSDLATTVRATLTTASSQPGPNSFVVRVTDYNAGVPVRAGSVRLQFKPIDDPAVASSDLLLQRADDDTYTGTGSNLRFDGRWRVTVVSDLDRGPIAVPLEIDLPTPAQFVSATRIPGEPPFYSVQIADETAVHFAIDPERRGPSRITVTFADVISDERAIESLVLTASDPQGVTTLPIQRLSRGRFTADADLPAGDMQLTATARTPESTRLRATLRLEVDDG